MESRGEQRRNDLCHSPRSLLQLGVQEYIKGNENFHNQVLGAAVQNKDRWYSERSMRAGVTQIQKQEMCVRPGNGELRVRRHRGRMDMVQAWLKQVHPRGAHGCRGGGQGFELRKGVHAG